MASRQTRESRVIRNLKNECDRAHAAVSTLKEKRRKLEGVLAQTQAELDALANDIAYYEDEYQQMREHMAEAEGGY